MEEKVFLSGGIKERFQELCTRRKVTAREVAEETGIDASTLSRLGKGKIQKVSDDVLLRLAKYFDVSTDFLLGLTDLPDKMYYTVEELGLSPLAAKNLYTGAVNAEVVSSLLEETHFHQIINMIDNYLSGRYEAERAVVRETFAGAGRLGRQIAQDQPAWRSAANGLPGLIGSMELELVPDDVDRILKHIRFLLSRMHQKREQMPAKEARTMTRKVYDDMVAECAKKKCLDPKTIKPEDIAGVIVSQLQEQMDLPPRILNEQKKVLIDILEYSSRHE